MLQTDLTDAGASETVQKNKHGLQSGLGSKDCVNYSQDQDSRTKDLAWNAKSPFKEVMDMLS